MSGAERLTARSSSSPSRRHSPSWRMAAPSTQLVRRREPPVRSASGTNSAGRDRPELRMRPAHQRLEAAAPLRVSHVDLGLVDERERVLVDGAAQVGDEGQPAAVLAVLARRGTCATRGCAPRRPPRARPGHAAAARRRCGRASGHRHTPQARRRSRLTPATWKPPRTVAASCSAYSSARSGEQPRRQHQELRLAEARQRVARRDVLLQAAGGLAQHLVAHRDGRGRR